MPVGQRAEVRVGGQVCFEPFSLGRIEIAAAGIAAVGVQSDQVPGADIETVIACSRGTGSRAVILGVTGRACIGWVTAGAARGEVLVVSDGGMGDG